MGIVAVMTFELGVAGFFLSLIVAALVQIPIRMYFELLMLFFTIRDEVKEIRKSTRKP